MSYNYVVTAQRPSKVTHSSVGNFLGGVERNLVVAKISTIEVYAIKFEGLVHAVNLPLYGRITGLQLFRLPGDSQDNLLVLTEKSRLAVLRWNVASAQCHTVLSCDVRDHLGNPTQGLPICIVDPSARCIGLHRHEHLFKVVPASFSNDTAAFNVRLLEDEVLDIVFLHNCKKPTIALLCQDMDDVTHIRTFEILLADQDMSAGPWSRSNLDGSVSRMIPMPAPYGGVIILAEQSISYTNGSDVYVTLQIEPMLVKAVGQVDQDGSRFLLGDQLGRLMMLVLDLDPKGAEVQALQIESLGETSSPSTISYLDKGFVYIGSDFGDSQLIRLNTEQNPETNSYVEVIQIYPHLGPITDFCIVKGVGHLRQGQGQVVTCSGAYKDSSLRVIRNGIGITEQASVELPGIKEMWSLRRHFGDRYHTYLVQSFASETRVLELIGLDVLAPATLPNIDEDTTTLYIGNMAGNMIVQVTSGGVRLLDCILMNDSHPLVWEPSGDSRVVVASGNSSQLLLATTGGTLVYLEVDPVSKTINEKTQAPLENEVACICCNPLGPATGDDLTAQSSALLAAVGLWADVNQVPTVELLALPSLSRVCTVNLEDDVMARSVLLATLEKQDYLLVALGDGHLLSYSCFPSGLSTGDFHGPNSTASDEGASAPDKEYSDMRACVLKDKRRLSIGTQPAALSLFRSKGANHVFAASDRPTVVYSDRGGGKLLVSNVNLEQVTRVCWFDTEAFPDCLAIATDEFLHLGAVDEIQKLHIQTIPLGQQARRIAHVGSAKCFAILTETTRIDEAGDDISECFVRVMDDTTYDFLHQHELQDGEVGTSIAVTPVPSSGTDCNLEYLVVGTGYEVSNEPESSTGRIIVFTIVNNKLVQLAEHAVDGVVYALVSYNGSILASVNSRIQLLSFTQDKDGILRISKQLSYRGHVLVCKLCTKGDFILAGDLMRSVTLLSQKTIGENGLEQLARDYDTAWTTALEFIDDSTFIMAENNRNLMMLQRNSSSSSDQERMRLDRVGVFHTGLQINRIQQGSLVMQMPEEGEMPVAKTMIFGTGEGMLGVIAVLKPESFQFFAKVEQVMSLQVAGLGGILHSDWRQFLTSAPIRSAPARGFVDGDLIECFLDLPASLADKVASAVGVTTEELTRRVEEIQRLTH